MYVTSKSIANNNMKVPHIGGNHMLVMPTNRRGKGIIKGVEPNFQAQVTEAELARYGMLSLSLSLSSFALVIALKA